MKHLSIIILASVTLMGCGKGRSNNPFRALATASKAPELQGTYENECSSSKKGWIKSALKGNFDTATYPSSERTQISFEGDAATIKEIHYLGSNCDGGAAFAFSEKGSFKIGDKDKNEKNNAGRYLDIEMKRVDAAVLSEAGAKFANAYGLCGITDWANQGEPRDVTGQAADGNCYDVTSRRTVANIYQVDNSTLSLGYTGDKARMSEERPTSLDTSNQFRRK